MQNYNYKCTFMKSNLLHIYCGLAMCLPLSVGSAFAAKNATVSIYPDKVGQTVGGIGGGIVYYQDWLTNHPNREAVYDTLFNGLGISCLRMGNWAIEDIESDKVVVNNDATIYKAAKEYLGKDLTVIMASWTPPAYLKASNSRNGSANDAFSSLKKENGRFVYDKYGKWWAESLQRYHDVGVYPDYISIQNEPDCHEDSYATMALGSTETNNVASYGKALAAVHREINKMPNPPKFIGADNLGIGWNQTQNYTNSIDKNLLSGYAFHYYHSGVNGNDRYSHPNDFIDAMKGLAVDLNDKPMFMTENSNLEMGKDLDCIYTAWFIANGFNINKLQYYIFWNLIWGDNGNGCIGLQRWDSTYAKNWSGGMEIHPTYHGLRHFSKFVHPGMKLIDTWASSNQMTTCGFISPDSTEYTLVFINQGNEELIVSHDWNINPDKYVSQVVLSVPKWNLYSSNMGEFDGEVKMPAQSVVTIHYTRRHPDVSPYVFTFDEMANNGKWTNPSNWNTKFVPWATDTLVIKQGECSMGNYTHHAPVTILDEGSLNVTGELSFLSSLTLHRSNIYFGTNLEATLAANTLNVQQPVVISVADSSNMHLRADIIGSADIDKKGEGTLSLLNPNHEFNGVWYVRHGVLEATAQESLGESAVEVVGGGLLVVNAPCHIKELRLQLDSTLYLKETLTATYAFLGGIYLINGEYTAEDYPQYISGDGKLVVDHPYPLINAPEESLTRQSVSIDSAIVNYSYTWDYADSVEVGWNPHQPAGLDVEVVKVEQTVNFSGAPNEVGEFAYTISTVSIEDSVVMESGLLTVLDPNGEQAGVDNIGATFYSVVLSPNKVRLGNEVSLVFTSPYETSAKIDVLNPTGALLVTDRLIVRSGRSVISLNVKTLPKGIYIVRVDCNDSVATFKLIVE